MKLVLLSGEVVECERHTLGYQYPNANRDPKNPSEWTREWNIRPLRLLYDGSPGFFVLAGWGSRGDTPAKRLIPVRMVREIQEPEVW